jgi:hypothetical protein
MFMTGTAISLVIDYLIKPLIVLLIKTIAILFYRWLKGKLINTVLGSIVIFAIESKIFQFTEWWKNTFIKETDEFKTLKSI